MVDAAGVEGVWGGPCLICGCRAPRQSPSQPAPKTARGRRRGPLSEVGAAGAARAVAGAEPSYGPTLSTPVACAASRVHATSGGAAVVEDEDGCCVGLRRASSRVEHCEGDARSRGAPEAHLPLADHVEVGELSSAYPDGEGHVGASPVGP